MAQRLKHLPAKRKTWVRSLDWEDPLEKEMATHSSTLALISYFVSRKMLAKEIEAEEKALEEQK